MRADRRSDPNYFTLSEEHRKKFGERLGTGSGARPVCAIDLHSGNRESNLELVANRTHENLLEKLDGTWKHSDDEVFGELFEFVEHCLANGLPQDAIELWNRNISFMANDVKSKLTTRGERFHIGSPLYNIGLCYFNLGDFDSALRYIAQAGIEDEQDGRGPRHHILVGKHVLSDQIIIDPFVAWAEAHAACVDTYQGGCGEPLEYDQLANLMDQMLSNPENAIQFVASLHRIVRSYEPPENHASRHARIRALADMAHLVESTMRAWQTKCDGVTLLGRFERLFDGHTDTRISYDQAHARFCLQFPNDQKTKEKHPDRESVVGINWAIQDGLSQIDASSSLKVRIGIAAYLVVRLRNSLMHYNDAALCLYSNNCAFERALGIVLAATRIVQLAESGVLP
jgi:tetratricopeptide (TPR) repeat protein